MSTFQKHFEKLQSIHHALASQTIHIDQAMILQKEAQEHVRMCQILLHGYQQDLEQSKSDLQQNPTSSVSTHEGVLS
jgi:exonuclease VII small subunit